MIKFHRPAAGTTDANGNIGLTVVYRNLLLYFTGPASAEGTAQVEFFANLAKSHLAWIKAQEQ